MSSCTSYAEPRHVEDPSDCLFYHVMDLPGIGEVGTGWDLRKTIDSYLGHFNFGGKRALDVGSASGYLSFEMEKRGATVVSFDMDSGSRWNIVPFASPQFDMTKLQKNTLTARERLVNGYWLAHRVLTSKAKVFYGSVYDLPADLGPFDVVMLGMILPHLQDPFEAMMSAARLSRDAIIITQQAYSSPHPAMLFMPEPDTFRPDRAWWLMSEPLVERILKVLGFELESKLREKHLCVSRHEEELCTTYVARRVR